MASSSSNNAQDGKVLQRANPNTIQDKFLVGYQGWFTCAGDGPPVHRGHHGWLHWFDKPIPDGGRPNIDLWPDTSEYSPSELYPAPGLTMADGSPACLFSSRNTKTVDRHFHWMALHGVDGAFLQRFAGQCEVDGHRPGEGGNADIMQLRDEVLRASIASAEKAGRVFAIMYDVSGVPADRIEHVIKTDWVHLVRDLAVLDSPNYLREGGKPVIALWGFGFAGRHHNPVTVRSIIQYLRFTTPGGAYIMAGAPTHWATLSGDADSNPGFRDVWMYDFDAISPWTIGRYGSEDAADRYAVEKIRTDMELLKSGESRRGKKVDYVPVVFPGGSGYNLSQGNWGLNDIPRQGGRFYWRQIYNARKEGARIVYGAMWDEYDEGTVLLPVVSSKRLLPHPGKFLALDADGQDLPPDWYMRISCFGGELLRGERKLEERFPIKELMDYWGDRPKYEERAVVTASGSGTSGPSGSSAAGSSSGVGTSSIIPAPVPAVAASASNSSTEPASEGVTQSFNEWSADNEELKDELPPPPYTLEALEDEAVPPEGPPATNSSTTLANTSTSSANDQPAHVSSSDSQAAVGAAALGHSISLGSGIGNTRPTSTMSTNSATSITSSHSAQSGFSAGGTAYIPPSRTSSLAQQALPPPQGRPQAVGVLHSVSLGHQPTGPSTYPGRHSPHHGHQPGQPSPSVNALANDFARYTLSDPPAPAASRPVVGGSTSQPHSPLPPQSHLPHAGPPRPASGGHQAPIPAGGAPRPTFSAQQWPPVEWQVSSASTPSSCASSSVPTSAPSQPVTGHYNPLTGWYRPPPTSPMPASPHAMPHQQQQQPYHRPPSQPQTPHTPHTPHMPHTPQSPWGMPQPGRLSPGHSSSFHPPPSPAQIPSPGHSPKPNQGHIPSPGAGSGYFPRPQVPGHPHGQQHQYPHSGPNANAYPHPLPHGPPVHQASLPHHPPPQRTSSLAAGGGSAEAYQLPVAYSGSSPSPGPSNESAYGGMYEPPVQGHGFPPSPGSMGNAYGGPAHTPLPSTDAFPTPSVGGAGPPPAPPRPPARPPASSSSFGNPGPGMPTPSTTQGRIVGVASEAYSLALGTVGKVAGADTRKQLEKGVDTLTACAYKREFDFNLNDLDLDFDYDVEVVPLFPFFVVKPSEDK